MDEIIRHLEFLQSISDKTSRHLTGKGISTIQLFCAGLLRRLDDTTSATIVLFQLLPKNHKYEFTIGVMFRAIILDSLITMSLYRLLKDQEREKKSPEETETAVKEFCNTFLSDGLNSTLSYIQDSEILGLTTAADTAKTFNSMGDVYRAFFEDYKVDGTRPILKFTKRYTAKQLFENLAKSAGLKEISKIYDGYAYLSKYDHFGIIYYNAINENLDNKINMYKNVTDTFIAHNAILHMVLASYSQNDEFIQGQSTLASNYLLKEVIKEKDN